MTHNFQLTIIHSFVYNLKSSTLFLIYLLCALAYIQSNFSKSPKLPISK